MRRSLIIVLFFVTACNNKKQKSQQGSINSQEKTTAPISNNKNVWVDRLTGKKHPLPDSIGNNPVSFYLENPKVADIAKAFYRGQFRPTDNDSTTQLLSYVTTDDNITRPFYRWCLDFTISISDGALGEYPGVPALTYATKFPKEFFDYIDKDTSRKRYKNWVDIIAYSGLNNYNEKESEIEKKIISKMHNNCYFCGGSTKSRIVTFAQDITKAVKQLD
jgi:hypothetical protein